MEHGTKYNDYIHLLYDIAMSIGGSLNLDKMLKVFLSVFLKKLNSSAGSVYFHRKDKSGDMLYEKVYSIPGNTDRIIAYQEALNNVTGLLSENRYDDFRKQLPISGRTGETGFYHILPLTDLGFMVILKSGEGLDPIILQSLDPILKKLSDACKACLYNGELKKTNTDTLELAQCQIAKSKEVVESKRALLNILLDMQSSEKILQETIQQKDIAYRQAQIYAQELNEEIAERKKTEHELARTLDKLVEIGGNIQETLLRGQLPQNIKGAEMTAISIPSKGMDGDFYEFFEHDEKNFDVIVGDVMGKGIQAALLGAGIKNQILQAVNRLILSSENVKIPEPEEIIQYVHKKVTKKLIDLESYLTLFFGQFDLKRKRVKFVDAGHTKMIHYVRKTGNYNLLKGENVPLGFLEDEIYKQVSVSFEEGDIFFLYSDGVTEARNKNGDLFGENRLADLIKLNNHLTPVELIKNIRETLISFSGSETFDDDFTCIAIQIEGAEPNTMLLEISNGLETISGVREFIKEFCLTHPSGFIDENTVNLLILAVNELASNLIKHGYSGDADKKIQIKAEKYCDRFEFQFKDWTKPFSPKTEKMPEFDLSKENGFGLQIVNSVFDKIEYFNYGTGENYTILSKYLKNNK